MGRWKGFPFYYTLLVLKELGTYKAKEERKYALPALERVLRMIRSDDEYLQIREAVLVKEGTEELDIFGRYEDYNFYSSI